MIYADYEFYKTEYFGVAISEADFPRLARHATVSYTHLDAAVAGLLSDERWEKVQEAFGAILEQDGEDDDGSWRRPPMMDVDAQGCLLYTSLVGGAYLTILECRIEQRT